MSHSILDAIGHTPLVEIRRLNPNPKVRILAKLEYMNPGGSIKDRAALQMILSGERSGELTPEKTVIEATSGNTGIGLALVCAVKGYRLLLAMSESASMERRQILQARGAEILLTPGHMGTDGAIEAVYRLAREEPERYFMADQYNNDANWEAHYRGTAPEIWEQTGGQVTTLVATMGTTGTLMGMSRRLKEFNPAIRVVGVEPYLGHKLQGLKNMKESYEPGLFDKGRLDVKVNVDDEDGFEMTRRLAREEGLMVGMSSGAAMAIAAKEAETLDEGTIVVIFPDGGERYLSTPLFTVQEKALLKLYNTVSRAKEPFIPSVPGKVSLYTCGPTAHGRLRPHEWRRFVFSDLLARYLMYRGYEVRHVMNITDLDDKTINGSERAGEGLTEFTDRHIAAFHADLETLGVRPADRYPRASEHVDEMVSLAERLVKKGFAYEKLRSLYFDIAKFETYGGLSGVDLEKIRVGATVDLDEYEKENPRDFTLFKRCKLSELKRGIFTATDWGNVRPSWHIQCAAMSMKYLGESFDIHAAGRELVFPHHENEMAIAQAVTGKPLARFWLHCDRVSGEEEISGDPEAFAHLDHLREMGFSGREIRYWLLSAHYRRPVGFSLEQLETARRSLDRLDACARRLRDVRDGAPYPELDQLLYDIRTGFTDAMDEDLNISVALASIFRNVRQVNKLVQEENIDPDGAEKVLDAFRKLDAVLNIFDFGAASEVSDEEAAALLRRREEARRAGDWETADRIRDTLRERGVEVQDGKVG
jgi:cysteinyl-tRNA synthetase